MSQGELNGKGRQLSSKGTCAAALRDRELVEGCIDGDESAWDQFYGLYHPFLLMVVRLLLGPRGADHELVEELSSRIWYALLKDRYRLLEQYDPQDRGCRFSTYVTSIARSEVRQHFRSEKRRQRRERLSFELRSNANELSPLQLELLVQDFSELLTPREMYHLRWVLMSSARDTEVTKQNQWQLSSRIRRKLHTF